VTTADGIPGADLSARIAGEAGAPVVEGALVYGTVADFAPALREAVADADTLDLSATTRIDSAGVALVVDAVLEARRAGRRLEIIGTPERMRSLLEVYGVADLVAGAAG